MFPISSHYNVSLSTMISAMINASVTPVQAVAMNDFLAKEGALLSQVGSVSGHQFGSL
jgi:hypothetical protein